VDLLGRHNVPLIEDDVYAELFFTPRRPLPAKAFDAGGLVMHCSSFSKSLAPGFRVGWAAPGRYYREVARNKIALNISTSLPPQLAVAEYLARGGFDKHLRRLRGIFSRQQAAMARAISEHFPAGTLATRPQGGYFLWVELPSGLDSMQLLADASKVGICIAPGRLFSPDPRFGNCLRLNYGLRWGPGPMQAIATLGELLRKSGS
jgi:DNA-binding transcriptional MocR family regulator